DNKAPTGVKTNLYFGQGVNGVNPIKLGIDSIRSSADLSSVLSAEYAGDMSVNLDGEVCTATDCAKQSGFYSVHKFFGYCLNDRVYATRVTFRGAAFQGQNTTINDGSSMAMEAALIGVMPPSHSPQIKGCRNRFIELVNLKVANNLAVSSQEHKIETLNFVFSLIPMYSGAESIRDGNTLMGSAEIIADIASLGFATKFKAGWKSLGLSERAINHARKGALSAYVVANTVRLAETFKSVQANGLNADNSARVVLIVLETGLTIARVKLDVKSSVKSSAIQTIDQAADIFVNKRKNSVILSKLFPNLQDEVIIGIDASGHAYLVVGKNQFHGGILQKISFKPSVNDQARSGVFIRLVGMDDNLKQKLFDNVSSYKHTPAITCANSVCRVLKKEAGITLGSGALIENGAPSSLLKNIIKNGVSQSVDGVSKNVKVDIFLTKPQMIDDVIKKTENSEIFMAAGLSTIIAGTIAIASSDDTKSNETKPEREENFLINAEGDFSTR
ncbi:MAG: hypothetical protein NT027_01290, partial [Proteobacteria bacterium]|nr:hypothetical protein [Pseudomonadota bacterium]